MRTERATLRNAADGHDWRFVGQDRGELLVDIYECQVCHAGYSEVSHDAKDVGELGPGEELDWYSSLRPGYETWDEYESVDCAAS